MTTKIRLVREFDDHEAVVVGLVETFMEEEKAREKIQNDWVEFQHSLPDSDVLFLEFLAKNNPSFKIIEDEFIDVVLD